MTTNIQSPPLKTDVLGRVRITAKHREALLDAYEQSSMSGAKFAAAHGVKYPTFASWIQKRRRDRGQYEPSNESVPAALLESLVELGLPLAAMPSEPRTSMTTGGAALRIQHPCGICMCVEDAHQARLAVLVLKELDETRPC
jgi:transposase-like protein